MCFSKAILVVWKVILASEVYVLTFKNITCCSEENVGQVESSFSSCLEGSFYCSHEDDSTEHNFNVKKVVWIIKGV